MSLRTHPLSLTSSDAVVFTVPESQQGVINGLVFTGSGNLTLKIHTAESGETNTVYDGKPVTDEFTVGRSINLSSGDQLIASGVGLTAFASVYYVGDGADSAVLPYGPGPQELQAGDMEAGYFGVVPSEVFYSGNRLALELGVTEGVLQNSDAGWLKFASKGRVLFIAKQTFMHSVSWSHLYSRGIVYGTNDNGKFPSGTPTNQFTTVEHGGNGFIVRLMTGANADPYDDTDPLYGTDDMCQLNIGGGSEWNRLMYLVSENVPSCPGDIPSVRDHSGGPQNGQNWDYFSTGGIGIVLGDGKASWCQEKSETSANGRCIRGFFYSVSYFGTSGYGVSGPSFGWRPVLELIPQSENL